jgi:zinc protease
LIAGLAVASLCWPLSAWGVIVPKRSVLDNGLVVLVSEQRTLPIVAITLLIEAGSLNDPPGREGVAHLTARLLTQGTKSRNALQISEALDFMGARLSASSQEETATISLSLLKKDIDAGLGLLGEILTESNFPVEEIDRQRQMVLAAIRAKRENPGDIAQNKFAEMLFPDSAYGRPVEGTEASVKRLERKGLVEFYERFYRPNRAILSVVGDVSEQEITQKLGRFLKPWAKKAVGKEPPSGVTPGPAGFVVVHKDITQANITMGHIGVPRDHPEYYVIQVMNYILGGGGFSARLLDAIRNERGLAYSVYSSFSSGRSIGSFQLTMQTKNESAREAIQVARDEIRRLREQGVTEEELRAAKDYLAGSFPLRFDTTRRVADFLAYAEFYELGLDYIQRYPELIRRVTREQVRRAAQRHLHPDKLIVVVVGHQDKSGLKKNSAP